MTRLTAEFWIDAYRRRLSLANIPAFIIHKGDKTAGSILVKLNTLNGLATIYHRVFAGLEGRIWAELASGKEAEIDQIIVNQRRNDPDLWVIEIESKTSNTLLEEDGLFD